MKGHNLEAFYKYYSNATKEQAIEDMYMDNCKLTEENEYLRFIIKEVREYIYINAFDEERKAIIDDLWVNEIKDILEILDKENEDE